MYHSASESLVNSAANPIPSMLGKPKGTKKQAALSLLNLKNTGIQELQ